MGSLAKTKGSLVLIGAFALTGIGCDGRIGDASSHSVPPIPGITGEYAPLKPAPSSMMRLTQTQYRNSIEDVFGQSAVPDVALPPDNTAEEFASIGATFVSSTEEAVKRYRDSALDAAEKIMANKAQFTELNACSPSDPNDPCIDDVFRHYASRLWRRSVSDEEVSAFVEIAGAAGDSAADAELGLQFVIAAILQSPNFLYISAAGEVDKKSSLTRYTSLELASRLSYFLWNSVPDAELLSVAEAGDLIDPDVLKEQAERMLEGDRAADLAQRFFARAWNVDTVDADSKDGALFAEWTPSLVSAARDEFDEVIYDLVTTPGASILDIFNGRESYANAELGALYGVEISGNALQRFTLDDTRAGLLTSPIVMGANSKPNRTSPTQRGVFVRANVLCLSVPLPPDEVDTSLEDEMAAEPGDLSVQESLDRHRNDPLCAGCHTLFDPMGLNFEIFDAIGRFRTHDGEHEIDSATVFEEIPFADARALGDFIRQDRRAADCMAKRFFSFAAGHTSTAGEQGVMDALGDYFVNSGESFRELALGVVTSSAFRYLSESDEQ